MHWKNSSFQVVAFIVGKCHTADEAKRKLLLLREERKQALDASKASGLRRQAQLLRAKKQLETAPDEADRLEAEATIYEIESSAEHVSACVDEAVREVEFIDSVLKTIEPYVKYAGMDEHEAFQAIQREEWCLELIQRAQNYLYTTGTIPTDHFATMRAHPDFMGLIRPIVGAMHEALLAKDINKLASYTVTPKFMSALVESKMFGPAPEAKKLLAELRLQLPATRDPAQS